jgi:hypothetical protein
VLVPQHLGPYALIGLDPPPARTFTDLTNMILTRPGNTNTPGKPILGNNGASITNGGGTQSFSSFSRSAPKPALVAQLGSARPRQEHDDANTVTVAL